MKLFLQKKGVYKSWIMSYFSLIVVFFIAFNGVALLSRRIHQDKVLQSNKAIFGLISTELENMKNELDKMSIQIMLNPNVIDVIKETNLDNNYYYKINTIRNDFQNLMISYGYVEKVILYKHNLDIFFIDGGLFDAERKFMSYPVKEHTTIEKGFDDWKSFICKKHNQELYATDNDEIVFINSISAQNEIQGTIIFVLNKEKIENIFRHLQNDMEANFLILNHMNELVFSFKDDKVKNFIEEKQFDLSAGQHFVKAGKEKIVMYISEKKSNAKYVYTIPSVAFYSSIIHLMTIIYMLTAVFIVFASFVALYHSKKNYMPVQKIVGLLEGYQYKNSKTNDEFTFINETLSEIVSEGVENRITKTKYNNKLFASELARLINDGVHIWSVEEVFEFYNISFSYSKYIAAAVIVDRIDDKIWKGNTQQNGTTEDELVEVAFSNVFGEILGSNYKVMVVGLNHIHFCLIGTNIDDEEKIKKNIKEAFCVAKKLSEENVGISYSLYASEVFKELSGLKKMYNQINSTYMFNSLIDQNIFFYDEISYVQIEDVSENIIEEKISVAVQKGDFNAIKRWIAQIMIQNDVIESQLDLAYIKYKILNTLFSSIQYTSQHIADIYLLVDKVNCSGSVIEFLRTLIQLIQNLCVLKLNNNEKDSKYIVDRIIRYVNENYSNSNVNVDQLGDEFSLSPSYLSNLFKIKTGEMLKDYIVKVRLKEARKLLASGNKVQEVAIKTGFGSSNSFIRIFKKHFQITPNQYKKNMEENL